ncbi:thioesterase domain-containing protein [Streptomyces sp. NPDC088766]|uniref:thioesterase domain-containing protein n=1 Tax=Streptomyces sp. NPDC088766 TaxID=3365893 RepID=UPI0037FA25FB
MCTASPTRAGSPGEYVSWGRYLPGTRIYGVCLPGRSSCAANRPALTDLDTVVRALLTETEFVAPHDLFGHGLGALIAYEAHASSRSGVTPSA